jgi:hypothetical protein
MIRKPLQRDVTRLRVVHRQRVLRHGDAEPAPPSEGPLVAPHLVGAARAGWQRLVETEYESVVIASWMTAGLARLGAPLDILGAFGRIVEDEIRHVDLCAQLVDKLGDHPTIVPAAVPPFPIAVDGAAAQEVEFELIAGLIGFFCVFEHLSAHVFREALDAAAQPVAKWAIAEIHRDEAFHGAFGFETAKLFVPSWSEAQRERLGTRVVDDIRRFEQRLGGPLAEGASAETSADERALAELGLLPAPHLLSVFYQAVQAELVPRLDELGVRVPLEVRRRG